MATKYVYQPEQLNRRYGTTQQNRTQYNNIQYNNIQYNELQDSRTQESTTFPSRETSMSLLSQETAAPSPIKLKPENILQGIIFSEILGKPKCLRIRRR
ncbi:MAG: hypothetical protein HPY74_07580 [Firmicutes bacterium]|nr:hypothetical protein [Bacillota bacterium]